MEVISQTYCHSGNPKEKLQEKIDTAFIRIRITSGEFEEFGSGKSLEHREFDLRVHTSKRTGKPYTSISRVHNLAEDYACDGNAIEPPENYL